MSESTGAWVWGELLKAVLNGRLTNVRFVLCGIRHPELDREMEQINEEASLGPLGSDDIVNIWKSGALRKDFVSPWRTCSWARQGADQ